MKGYTKITVQNTDNRFPGFLQGFNRRWFAGNCNAVYLCYDAIGVVDVVNDATALYGKNIKIKSGGHCYENFVYSDTAKAIIDITPLVDFGFNKEKGYYLGSGNTNWSAFQVLYRDYGKVLPAGSCYSVGLGGHICGGGYGLLSRLNGLTIDWLTGVDVVVKDQPGKSARSIYVSKNATDPGERDLFWAHCGGGGGNFGVITRYYFNELPDSPATAYISSLAISWNDLTETILHEVLDWMALLASRDDNWRQFGICALFHKAHGEIVITVQTAVLAGEKPNLIYEQYVRPVFNDLEKITAYKTPSKSSVPHLSGLFRHNTNATHYTFYEAVQTLNGSGANQRGKYKSAYMRKPFPPEQVGAIYRQLQNIPAGLTLADMTQSLLQVDTYGGRINIVDSAATAIPQRSSILKLQYQTYWTDEQQDEAHLQWIRDLYTSVYAAEGGVPNPEKDPTHNVDGCYYNYPDVDLNEVVGDTGALKLYFGNNLNRLIKTKQKWDPENYFNHRQSVPV
jgi:hexose oxidase